MKTVEIVTHCFAGVLPQYAAFLRWQAGSLLHYPPKTCEVRLAVCYTPHDAATRDALLAILGRPLPFTVHTVAMDPAHLFRRAIGRNTVAQGTRADVVWFTDVDYAFGPGALDAVAELGENAGLHYPAEVRIQNDHQTGDRMVAEWAEDELPKIDESLFTARREKRSIGGLQIVGGAVARRGYLPGTPWQRPADLAKGFLSCKCDVAYRRSLRCGGGTAIDVPNVYRARHTRDGRDYDGSGVAVGKAAWK